MQTRMPEQLQRPPAAISRRGRVPFRITLLLILVLITTVLSAVRFLTAIAWNGTLDAYISAPLTAYVALTGAIWALVGAFVLWSFWRGMRRTGMFILVAAAAYALWVWIDRLLIQSGSHANWLFELIVTIGLLGYAGAVVLDPRNRAYFRRESHEQ